MTNVQREARNHSQRLRRARRKDELNAAERTRRATDPSYAARKRERTRQSVKEWNTRNPELRKAAAKKHYDKFAKQYQEIARAYYWQHRDERKTYSKRLYHADRARWLADQKARALVRKLACFDAYGGRLCACCGETTLEFLTLDHINGCSTTQRKTEGYGSTNYRRLLKAGFPAGLRVLCFNCNCGRRVNGGICPHQGSTTT